jgi:hypothetical protein
VLSAEPLARAARPPAHPRDAPHARRRAIATRGARGGSARRGWDVALPAKKSAPIERDDRRRFQRIRRLDVVVSPPSTAAARLPILANRFDKIDVVPDPDARSIRPSNLRRKRLPPRYTRTIIATNDSPDVMIEASVKPYRGCEHGCIYCLRPSRRTSISDFRSASILRPRFSSRNARRNCCARS